MLRDGGISWVSLLVFLYRFHVTIYTLGFSLRFKNEDPGDSHKSS